MCHSCKFGLEHKSGIENAKYRLKDRGNSGISDKVASRNRQEWLFYRHGPED